MSSSNAVATRTPSELARDRRDPGAVMEQVITKGDLGQLSGEERARYYVAVCESMGLNPFTNPFQYIVLDKVMTLYPRKEAADQLRGIHHIETRILSRDTEGGIHTVVVEARAADGRVETDIGAVMVQGLSGQLLANALMKAVTKAKRRATLAMVGLSFLDEDEIKAIKGARFVQVDTATGVILDDGPPVPAITNRHANAEQDHEEPTPSEDWDAAYERYRETAVDHGWTEEAADLLAKVLAPDLNQLFKLTDLVDLEIGCFIDGQTDKVLPTPEVEFANAIAIAPDKKAMADIAAKIKDASFETPWLREIWKFQNKNLPTTAAANQSELAGVGAAGADRYTK